MHVHLGISPLEGELKHAPGAHGHKLGRRMCMKPKIFTLKTAQATYSRRGILI